MNTRDIFKKNLNRFIEQSGKNKKMISEEMNIPYTTLAEWANGNKFPRADGIEKLANYFKILKSDLLEEEKISSINLPPPTITEDYSEIPVIGGIAAGYNRIAYENWEGETVPIPNHYLKGHNLSDYFVLNVNGSSMYPMYQDGDRVLILKQSTLNHSGQVGAILYNDEFATLKKVEYVMGEDWMKLVPINPNYEPELIEGEALEHCRVIGIPKLLIRDIKE